MNLHTILQHPGRVPASAVPTGLLFAAGTAAGTQTAQTDTTQPRRDVPRASTAADADTLLHYLATLTPHERAQTITALDLNLSRALEAIAAGNAATADTR